MLFFCSWQAGLPISTSPEQRQVAQSQEIICLSPHFRPELLFSPEWFEPFSLRLMILFVYSPLWWLSSPGLSSLLFLHMILKRHFSVNQCHCRKWDRQVVLWILCLYLVSPITVCCCQPTCRIDRLGTWAHLTRSKIMLGYPSSQKTSVGRITASSKLSFLRSCPRMFLCVLNWLHPRNSLCLVKSLPASLGIKKVQQTPQTSESAFREQWDGQPNPNLCWNRKAAWPALYPVQGLDEAVSQLRARG